MGKIIKEWLKSFAFFCGNRIAFAAICAVLSGGVLTSGVSLWHNMLKFVSENPAMTMFLAITTPLVLIVLVFGAWGKKMMADDARIAAEARASAAEAECARLHGEPIKESQPPLKPVQVGASPQYDPCTGQVFCTACRALGRPSATVTLDHFPSLDETLFRCPCGHTEHAHGKVSIVPAKDGKGFESVTEEYSIDEIPAPSFVIA